MPIKNTTVPNVQYTEYNILSKNIFRDNNSTYMTMIDLVDKISSSIDQKNQY